ncbi:MAG: hypothetical protein ACRC24_06855 [Vibrionaceae bacterium]
MTISRNNPNTPPVPPRGTGAAGAVQQGQAAGQNTVYADLNIVHVGASDVQVETNSTTSATAPRRSFNQRMRDAFRRCFSCYRKGDSSAARRTSDASNGNVNHGFEGDGDLHYADIQHGSGAGGSGSRNVNEAGLHYADLQGLSGRGATASGGAAAGHSAASETEYSVVKTRGKPAAETEQTSKADKKAAEKEAKEAKKAAKEAKKADAQATKALDKASKDHRKSTKGPSTQGVEGLYAKVDKSGKTGQKTQTGTNTSDEMPSTSQPSSGSSSPSSLGKPPMPLPRKQVASTSGEGAVGGNSDGGKTTPPTKQKPAVAPKPTSRPVFSTGAVGLSDESITAIPDSPPPPVRGSSLEASARDARKKLTVKTSQRPAPTETRGAVGGGEDGEAEDIFADPRELAREQRRKKEVLAATSKFSPSSTVGESNMPRLRRPSPVDQAGMPAGGSSEASQQLFDALPENGRGLIKIGLTKDSAGSPLVKLEPSQKGKVMYEIGRLVLARSEDEPDIWTVAMTAGQRFNSLNLVTNETTLGAIAGPRHLVVKGNEYVINMQRNGRGTVALVGSVDNARTTGGAEGDQEDTVL